MSQVSEHSPIFIGRANIKNNWKEIVRVFIQVKVYLKRSLKRAGMGRGSVRVEEKLRWRETAPSGDL